MYRRQPRMASQADADRADRAERPRAREAADHRQDIAQHHASLADVSISIRCGVLGGQVGGREHDSGQDVTSLHAIGGVQGVQRVAPHQAATAELRRSVHRLSGQLPRCEKAIQGGSPCGAARSSARSA